MKDQKTIILFLLKFVGLYVVLNTGYGLWIASYEPMPDPMTTLVTRHSVSMISLTEKNVTVGEPVSNPNVPVIDNGTAIIQVFEGCNGINVMIVFLSFVIAFTGTLKKTLLFVGVGLLSIYIANLFRVSLLFFVAKYYPDNLYFFHKYLFTGLLYILVFVLWYFWVTKIWPKKI
jgi:exosortase family protein XrtF